MSAQHFLEHRNWAQPRSALQQRHHLAVEDVDQRVRPTPAVFRRAIVTMMEGDLDRLLAQNATAAARERLTLIRLFEKLRAPGL